MERDRARKCKDLLENPHVRWELRYKEALIAHKELAVCINEANMKGLKDIPKKRETLEKVENLKGEVKNLKEEVKNLKEITNNSLLGRNEIYEQLPTQSGRIKEQASGKLNKTYYKGQHSSVAEPTPSLQNHPASFHLNSP
ncbi:MAG: hypothetical protein Q9201_007695, partial [Fulgogasparrea decipioides]